MKTKMIQLMMTLMIATSGSALTLGGKNVNFTEVNNYANNKIRTLSLYSEETLLVKAKMPLTKEEKQAIYDLGVTTITYTGDLSYIVYGKQSSIQQLITMLQTYNTTSIYGVSEMAAAYKALETVNNTTMTDLSNGKEVTVLFLDAIEEEALETLLQAQAIDAEIVNVNSQLKKARVIIAESEYQKLLNLPVVQFVENSPQLLSVQ
jgi:hypothetical protein